MKTDILPARSIDTEVLVARCMGKASVALSLLDALKTTGGEHVDKIARHAASGDCEESAAAAHALKGAAAIVAAERLSSLAAEVQSASELEDVDRIDEQIDELRQEMERCLTQIPEIRDQIQKSGK